MFYKFNIDFQRHLIASILSDDKLLKNNLDIFIPENFNDEILTGIADCIKEFYCNEKEIPSKEALIYKIKNNVAPGRKLSEYIQEIEQIYEKIGINTSYYQNTIIEFARSQSIAKALKESNILLESGEIDKINNLIKDAIQIGDSNHKSYNYLENIKSRAINYSKIRIDNKDRIKTGYYVIDERMQGGLGKGELGMIVAPPKHGKTTMLINIGANSLVMGKNVLYVTLELRESVISSKFDSRFMGENLTTIKNKTKSFFNKMIEIKNKLKSNLHIVEFPTKSLSMHKLISIIENMDNIDLIIIDYGDLMKSPYRRDDRRHELTDIFEGLRKVAGETKTAIWTASQGNRPSVGSKIVGMENVAEDFNKVAIVDVSISINQTEEERRLNKLRLYMMANRLGASGDQIECDVNWATSKITLTLDEDIE